MTAALSCPSCATPVMPGARFCFHCGTGLDNGDHGADEHAERRVVTVLFGDLSEFTAWAEHLDPERVKDVTDRLLSALANAVTSYGGHIDKLTGDGLMALFGAPIAHEDDPERAVRAATAMQAAVHRLVADEVGGGRQLGLRVGLNTGEVLAGVQAALSYTVVGDAVNTASRLSDVAPIGAVLAGQETARATMSVASWRALPMQRLKGKRDEVAAYELIALHARDPARLGLGDEAPLVGREAELGLLRGRLRDVADRRRPMTVLITGDAGLGKTRLVREFGRFAATMRGARVVWGACPAYGEQRDLAPFADIVRTMCGVEPGDDAARVSDRLRRMVSRLDHPAQGAWAQGIFADQLLSVLGLTEAEPAESPRPGATPGEPPVPRSDEARALAALWRALASDGPLTVVIDDAHWATDGCLDLLHDVGGQLDGAILLILLGRGGRPLLDSRDLSRSLPEPAWLPLEPLTDAAAERLLAAYLGSSTIDDVARGALLARAAGNPFFLAELLHLLIDRGLLHRGETGWLLDGDLPPEVLPAGVQAVLAARIDELDPAAKATLRDVAIVGDGARVDVLAAIAGTTDADVTGRLSSLVGYALLVPRDDGYGFAHTLVRDVAYRGLAKAERAHRHATVARWATDQPPSNERDVLVVRHAERAVELASEMGLPAEDPAWSVAEDGISRLTRLGRSALGHDENREAADLLSRALRLADVAMPKGVPVASADVLLGARVAYAQALHVLHRLDEAEAEASVVLDAGDASQRAEALIVLGEVHRKRGEDDAARAQFVRAIAASGDAGDDRLASEAIRSLGLLDFYAGRLRDAETHFAEALTLAERVDDARGRGWALQHLAWSSTTRGNYALAESRLDESRAVFTALGDVGGLAWASGTEAFVRLLQGRLSEARSLTSALLPVSEVSGDRWGLAACRTIDALAGAELGDVAGALEQSALAVKTFEEFGDTWGLTLALIARGVASDANGDGNSAIALLRQAVDVADKADQPSVRILALLTLGWLLRDAGELDDAAQVADTAREVIAKLEMATHTQVGLEVLVAMLERARGEFDSALARLARIAESEESPTLLFPMRRALAHYAGTLLDAGRVDDAVLVAERALTTPAEDVRSLVLTLRALGAAYARAERPAEAEQALREAVHVARTGSCLPELAQSERVFADFLARSA